MGTKSTDGPGTRSDPVMMALGVQFIRKQQMKAQQAENELKRLVALDPLFKGRTVPSYRTLDRTAKKPGAAQLADEDGSAAWSPAIHDVGSSTVLAVIPELIERTNGQIRGVTVAEVEHMVMLERFLPDRVPLDIWRLARVYASRLAEGASTEDLDAFVAFAPWRGGLESWDRYNAACEAGYVTAVPQLVQMMLDHGFNRDRPEHYAEIVMLDRLEREYRQAAVKAAK